MRKISSAFHLGLLTSRTRWLVMPLLLALLLCIPFCNMVNAAQPTLKSASELDYPPFAVVTPDGKADGFSVDLLETVVRSLNLSITFKVGPWHIIKQELADGQLDVLPLVSYSKEREQYYDFSIPYLKLHGAIFVRKGETSIRGEEDLRDKEVITMQGDTAHEYALRKHLTDKLFLTETFEEAMKQLSAGKHDAVIVQQVAGLQILKNLGITNVVDISASREDNLKPFGQPLADFEQKFCFAVRKGNHELLAKLNEGLTLAITNGKYDELYLQWFGPILPAPPINRKLLLKYTALILFPCLFIISLFGIWYFKREVRNKTLALRIEIDERKRAEEELILARDQALSATRTKSEFLANMSHEIRTPMNGIVGMLQLLENTQLNEEQKELARAATSSATRLTSLLSDILDLSRVEAGKLTLYEVPFVLHNQKTAVLELFEMTARQKGLLLEFTLDEQIPPTLVGDKARLRQILFNLVGNAIKFTDHGSVRVNASLVSSGDTEVIVQFSVTDTGPGIAANRLKDIFEPFVQLENERAKASQGAGLGLSIVRKLATLMKGHLDILSTEGEGSTISVSLPFRIPLQNMEALEPELPRQGETMPHPQKDFRILLAEDDLVSSIFAQRVLKQLGYSVTLVSDGQQALEALEQQDFDLILMDVQMPIMTGVEATEAIRTSTHLGPKARIPIIAMTAYTMTGDREAFLAAGMNNYISKPIEITRLDETIKLVMMDNASHRKG